MYCFASSHTQLTLLLLLLLLLLSQLRMKIRIITSRAYHALFMHNMLIRPRCVLSRGGVFPVVGVCMCVLLGGGGRCAALGNGNSCGCHAPFMHTMLIRPRWVL
jgi:hypothetical protein